MSSMLVAMTYFGFPFEDFGLFSKHPAIEKEWELARGPKPPKNITENVGTVDISTLEGTLVIAHALEHANVADQWRNSVNNVAVRWVGVGNSSKQLILHVPFFTRYSYEGESRQIELPYKRALEDDEYWHELVTSNISAFCRMFDIPHQNPDWYFTARYS